MNKKLSLKNLNLKNKQNLLILDILKTKLKKLEYFYYLLILSMIKFKLIKIQSFINFILKTDLDIYKIKIFLESYQ